MHVINFQQRTRFKLLRCRCPWRNARPVKMNIEHQPGPKTHTTRVQCLYNILHIFHMARQGVVSTHCVLQELLHIPADWQTSSGTPGFQPPSWAISLRLYWGLLPEVDPGASGLLCFFGWDPARPDHCWPFYCWLIEGHTLKCRTNRYIYICYLAPIPLFFPSTDIKKNLMGWCAGNSMLYIRNHLILQCLNIPKTTASMPSNHTETV